MLRKHIRLIVLGFVALTIVAAAPHRSESMVETPMAVASVTSQDEFLFLPLGMIQAICSGPDCGVQSQSTMNFDNWHQFYDVMFIGNSCENSFDLRKESLDSHKWTQTLYYKYNDGTGMKTGQASTTGEGELLANVCFAYFSVLRDGEPMP